jgi:hypothetical protein
LFLNYQRNEDKAKYLFPSYWRNEDEAKYLFLNYRRNEDEAKYLFLNYLRNEDEAKYLFLNYRWFAIASRHTLLSPLCKRKETKSFRIFCTQQKYVTTSKLLNFRLCNSKKSPYKILTFFLPN